jgi:hypothetical protein
MNYKLDINKFNVMKLLYGIDVLGMNFFIHSFYWILIQRIAELKIRQTKFSVTALDLYFMR